MRTDGERKPTRGARRTSRHDPIRQEAAMTLRTDPRSRPARTLWALILALLPWPVMAFLLSH